MPINTPFIYLDLWSLTHFAWGMVIFFILVKFFNKIKTPKKFVILFILFVLWEVFESKNFGLMNFTVHGPMDTVWDTIIGMLGGLTTYFLLRKN